MGVNTRSQAQHVESYRELNIVFILAGRIPAPLITNLPPRG